MTVEDDFLAAIGARSTEDKPLLAYADWLAERGQGKCALLRIRIFAKIPPKAKWKVFTPEVAEPETSQRKVAPLKVAKPRAGKPRSKSRRGRTRGDSTHGRHQDLAAKDEI